MQRSEKIINGIKVSYIHSIIQNDAPIVVFLHGWASEGIHFKNLFPQNQSFIAIDFPPFGKSGDLPSSVGLLDFANITKKWIEYCVPCNKKIIVVGHSFGGRIIIKMISEQLFSHQIEKIICIGVPFYRQYSWKHYIIERCAYYFSFAPIFKKSFKKILYSFWKNSDYEALGENIVLKKTFQNTIKEPIDTSIPLLSAYPLFLLWGEKDEITPVSFAQRVQAIIPSACLEVVPSAGHMPFIDSPSICRSVFFKMLQK